MGKICAFFGHREINSNIAKSLEAAIHAAIEQYGISSFWCGNYGSFDSAAAHAVKQMKKNYPHIELLWVRAYIPSLHETPNTLYDASFYPEDLESAPKRFAIAKRNAWIIHHCDLVIAYINSSYGGAYTACHRYIKTGKPLINLGTLPHL